MISGNSSSILINAFNNSQFSLLINNSNGNTNNSNNSNQIIKDESTDSRLRNRLFNKKEPIFHMNKFLNQRSYGNRNHTLYSEYGLHHLISNNLLKEEPISLGEIDKVYSSCWLDDDFVICGTKCNKVRKDKKFSLS